MANNIKTIGATGADYTTVAAFAADLDDGTNAAINATAYSSGDTAIAELIDATYTQTATAAISGGGSAGLSQIIIRPASGNKHDGTFGSGCVITCEGASAGFCNITTNVNITIEDLEFSGVGEGTYSHSYLIRRESGTATVTIQRCLLSSDGASRTSGAQCAGIYDDCNSASATLRVINCIVRRFKSTPGSNYGSGMRIPYSGNIEIDNCTITGCYVGVHGAPFTPTCSVRNSLVMGSGSADFSNAGPWDTVTSLLTGDDSLGVETTQTTTELFVNYAGGNFVPISGSDLIGTATDLGTTPTGVNFDLKGRDRDAEGDTWDVGAIQTFEAGGSAVPIIIQRLYR